MNKFIKTLAVCISILFSVVPSAAFAAPSKAQLPTLVATHAAAMLKPVQGSKIAGYVDLRQLKEGGTHITLLAFGMQPGHNYVSLYYGNHTCALEPYSADDVIGGIYTANSVGVGVTHGNADDDLDEINSVSVRDADTFNLLACANVHP
jgi:hypothetical protein